MLRLECIRILSTWNNAITAMALTSKDIVPITAARARLTELADEVASSGEPKLITKNGESYVALITAEQLDELQRFQLAEAQSILRATAEALEEVNAGKGMTWEEFRPRLLEMRDRLREKRVAATSALMVAEPPAPYRARRRTADRPAAPAPERAAKRSRR
jgi:prevent-host-death family protein